MSYHCTGDFVGELRKYRNKKMEEVELIEAAISLIRDNQKEIKEIRSSIVPKFDCESELWFCGNRNHPCQMLGTGGTSHENIVTMMHNQYCRICGKKVDWESVLNKYGEIKNESIDCD